MRGIMKYFGREFDAFFREVEVDFDRYLETDDDPFWVVQKVLEGRAVDLPIRLHRGIADAFLREREKIALARSQMSMFRGGEDERF